MQQAQSLEVLNACAAANFGALGFEKFVGIHHCAPGGKPDVQVLFGASPIEWEERFITQNYQAHDACIPVALGQTDPFFWSEVQATTEISPTAQHIFDEAREFGLNNGLLIPMHHLDGSICSVLLTGSQVEELDPQLRVTAHMLAIYFGGAGQRLIGREARMPARTAKLTERQRDVLRWVREGKSSTDIGDILNLSPRTIDEHVKLACDRLGVRTRVQAVSEAALHGLIDL
jgi:LuxR family quorum sensing-dependent transcriptional regulator